MSVTTAAKILQPTVVADQDVDIKEMAMQEEETLSNKDEAAEIVKCSICGKALRDPESIAREIGPVCWKKEQIRLAVGAKGKTGGENTEP
jgi:replication initiation and membrane attachment protein DnaB